MSSAMHARHPFTPQMSPPVPSSQASQSPPASEGGEFRAEAEHLMTSTVEESAQIGTESWKSAELVNHATFNCWTAHQSHGKLTVLFYVPRWAKERDVQVVIGSDYLLAGLKQSEDMVIQAQLSGRVDAAMSHWQLEKPSNKRRRRHKSKRMMPSAAALSRDSNSNSSDGGSANGKDQQSRKALRRFKGDTVGTTSPASSSGVSSFDMLAHSTDISQRDARSSHPGTPPNRLDQSITLSEGSGCMVPDTLSGEEGSGGVRSLSSSISFEHSHSGSSAQVKSDEEPLVDAKLVTIYLDKIDTGIWPFLVSGPASRSLLSTLDSMRSISVGEASLHPSLSAAVSKAFAQPSSSNVTQDIDVGVAARRSFSEGDDTDNFNQSSTTIDTICSDDSTTVLGTRGASVDEDEYEMDPISLTLMGIRDARQVHPRPYGSTSKAELSAFEYFKRAWRKAEVPLATKRLVEDFLPPLAPEANKALMTDRSRKMASLGGPSALARLYVSYARIILPSYEERRPPLAFPLSGVSNPYGGSGGHDHPSSPRSQSSSSIDYEAILLFREARNLDKNVVISDEEWSEAQAIDLSSQAGDDNVDGRKWSRDDQSQVSESDHASHAHETLGSKRRKGGKLSKKAKKMTASGTLNHREEKLKTSDQTIFLYMGGTALISVLLAGGVAMAGWWKRAGTTVGGG